MAERASNLANLIHSFTICNKRKGLESMSVLGKVVIKQLIKFRAGEHTASIVLSMQQLHYV
jgi:hypothetical protein